MKIRTGDGLNANLDEGHWEQHVLAEHPELGDRQGWVVETLKEPNGVYRSKRDPGTRVYVRVYREVRIGGEVIAELSLRVYVREANGFVVTAHFVAAAFRSLGEKIWPL